MKEYRMGSALFTPQERQLVEDIKSKIPTSYTEVLNTAASAYVKDAAGSTLTMQLLGGIVLNPEGSAVGKYWGDSENMSYERKLNTLIQTDGAAEFSVYDPNTDLEKIFESVTFGRYIAIAYDQNGLSLKGYIGGVAVSASVYTFSMYSESSLSNQNWFELDSTGFSTKLATVQIYKNTSSLVFASADTFTEEVPYNEKQGLDDFSLFQSLTNGQYAIDYERGTIRARKANADDTESVTYMTYASYPYISPSGTTVGENSNITQVDTVAVPTAGADAVNNTRSDVPTSSRISGFNGTTWDRIKAGITTVTATLTGFLNTLPWTIYNASPTTRTEGQGGTLQATSEGSLKTRDDVYDSSSGANKAYVTNPDSGNVVDNFIDVDTTNLAASLQYFPSATGIANPYPTSTLTVTMAYIDAHAVATLFSVQGTNDEDTATTDWTDIQGQIQGMSGTLTGTVAGVAGTALVPGSIVTNITTAIAQTAIFTLDFDTFGYRYLRLAVTPGDATNTIRGKVRIAIN